MHITEGNISYRNYKLLPCAEMNAMERATLSAITCTRRACFALAFLEQPLLDAVFFIILILLFSISLMANIYPITLKKVSMSYL